MALLRELGGRVDVFNIEPVLRLCVESRTPQNLRAQAAQTAAALNPERTVAWLTQIAQSNSTSNPQRCLATAALADCFLPQKTLKVIEQLAAGKQNSVDVRLMAIKSAVRYHNLRTLSVLLPLQMENDDRIAVAATRGIDELIASQGGAETAVRNMIRLVDKLEAEKNTYTARKVLETASSILPRHPDVVQRQRRLRAVA
jgi:hypothetical protein